MMKPYRINKLFSFTLTAFILAGCQGGSESGSHATSPSSAELVCKSTEDCQAMREQTLRIIASKQASHERYMQTLQREMDDLQQRLSRAKAMGLAAKTRLLEPQLKESQKKIDNENRNHLQRVEQLRKPLAEIEQAMKLYSSR